MSGVILAGVSDGRMCLPAAETKNQLLSTYEKHLVYRKLSALMLVFVYGILRMDTPDDLTILEWDGLGFGVGLSYVERPPLDGLAQAFLTGEELIVGVSVSCALIVENSIFRGDGFFCCSRSMVEKVEYDGGAAALGNHANALVFIDVIEFYQEDNPEPTEEMLGRSKSSFSKMGSNFFTSCVYKTAGRVKLSARGKSEIFMHNQICFEDGNLSVAILGRGYAWLNTGTMENAYEASLSVRSVKRTGPISERRRGYCQRLLLNNMRAAEHCYREVKQVRLRPAPKEGCWRSSKGGMPAIDEQSMVDLSKLEDMGFHTLYSKEPRKVCVSPFIDYEPEVGCDAANR